MSALSRRGAALLGRGMSTCSRLNLSGIYPPVPTPFNSDETIAFDRLGENLEKWAKIPFAGIVVQGSNGECPFLSPDEKIELVRFTRKAVSSDKLLIAGSGCESTKDTITMSAKMAAAGADAVMVVTPSFYKGQMNDSVLIHHYTAVADASPVPIILYSVPGNTGIDLSAKVICHMSRHPNVAGLKDSGGDVAKLASLVRDTRHNDFQILAGSASFLLPAFISGCVGGVCALANVLGEEVCLLHKLYVAGTCNSDLQQRLIEPNSMVTKVYGVAGLKAAMDMFGYYGGRTRSPLLSVSGEAANAIRKSFADSGFPVAE